MHLAILVFVMFFFESVWQENMKPFVEKQGQWVVTRFDLLFNSDSLVHLRVSKRYHTSTGKPKIRPIGVGSLKLGDGIGMIS